MRTFLVLLCLTLLTACGFKLRGAYDLPFDTIYVSLAETSEFRAELKRNIEAGSKTKVISEMKEAQARLIVTGDISAKNILSLNSAGRVSEYQLVRTFAFRLIDSKNRDYLPPAAITVRRDISFNDDAVLSKESEEALLQRDMQRDLVQQILRRLATAKVVADLPAGTDAATR